MRNKVLVSNGGSLIALTVARSLAKRGKRITLVTDCDLGPVASSVSVSEKIVLPSPKNSPHEYIVRLERYLMTYRYDALFPIGTNDTLLVSKHLDKLSRYCHIPFLPYDRIYAAHNKKNLVAICKKIGLKVPLTIVPEIVKEIEQFADKISFPVVIKPQDSTGSKGLAFAKGPHELITNYISVMRELGLSEDKMPLIQEHIDGTGYGVSCLYYNGQLRAFFTHKRIRELSPSGGASTCRESIRHPKMEEMAFKLLDYLQWHGVAMVEFKLDNRTGDPVIIEVNPRFWGSLHTAIMAGVDFPWLLYKMSVEGDIDAVTDYRVGIRSRCLLTDAVSLLRHIKGGSLTRSYLADFLGLHGLESHYEVLSWKDPKPFIVFLMDHLVKRRNFSG